MSLYVSLYICILRETLSVLASNSIPCFLQESLLLHSMKKTEKKEEKKRRNSWLPFAAGAGGPWWHPSWHKLRASRVGSWQGSGIPQD